MLNRNVLSVFAVALLAIACTKPITSSSSDTSNNADDGSGTDNDNNGSDAGAPGEGEDSGPKLVVLPSAKATQISVGRLHACAVTDAGGARCWGYSSTGQLGNNKAVDDDESFPVPVQVVGLETGVKMIATYSDHTCALTTAGGVKCWGDDELGQLGTGVPYTDNRKHASSTPLDVKDLTSGVIAISTGDVTSCALLSNHTVKCWGRNGASIGDGNDHTPGDQLPNTVTATDTGLTDIAQISVGHEHACAVTNAGTVKCWGSNTFGELGIGTDDARQSVPTDVPGLTNVVAVSSGGRTTCALLASGAVKCWGTREYGSLGDGKIESFSEARSPIDIPTLASSVTEIDSGSSGFACAVISGGAKCWGDSQALGTKEGDTYRTYAPAGEVVGLGSGTGVTQVGTGTEFACALLASGAIKCWGDNGGGMLGDGKGGVNGSETSHEPVSVVSFP